jgi:hypothetical protein
MYSPIEGCFHVWLVPLFSPSPTTRGRTFVGKTVGLTCLSFFRSYPLRILRLSRRLTLKREVWEKRSFGFGFRRRHHDKVILNTLRSYFEQQKYSMFH